jgi:hypothetical protein
MTTRGNDRVFPSSIQRRNICQNSRIKLDSWRETLRRFQLDSRPNLMTTRGNDRAFPSRIQRRNRCQNSRIKHDPCRETLRRFHLDSIPNLITTHGNDGEFPSAFSGAIYVRIVESTIKVLMNEHKSVPSPHGSPHALITQIAYETQQRSHATRPIQLLVVPLALRVGQSAHYAVARLRPR